MKPKKKLNQVHEAFGRQHTMIEWAQEARCTVHALRNRVRAGHSLEEAITRSVRPLRIVHSIAGDNERESVVEYAAEAGVTRQAVHQIVVRAMDKALAYSVLWACIDWERNTGTRMGDRELADIVRLVVEDEDVRQQWLTGVLDAGKLCLAAKRLTVKLRTSNARFDNE